jgi:hypothetical protein
MEMCIRKPQREWSAASAAVPRYVANLSGVHPPARQCILALLHCSALAPTQPHRICESSIATSSKHRTILCSEAPISLHHSGVSHAFRLSPIPIQSPIVRAEKIFSQGPHRFLNPELSFRSPPPLCTGPGVAQPATSSAEDPPQRCQCPPTPGPRRGLGGGCRRGVESAEEPLAGEGFQARRGSRRLVCPGCGGAVSAAPGSFQVGPLVQLRVPKAGTGGVSLLQALLK